MEWKIVDRQNPFEMQKKSFSSNSAFILMKFNQKNNKRRVSEKVNKRKISSAVKFRRMSKLLELFLCFRSNKDGVHYLWAFVNNHYGYSIKMQVIINNTITIPLKEKCVVHSVYLTSTSRCIAVEPWNTTRYQQVFFFSFLSFFFFQTILVWGISELISIIFPNPKLIFYFKLSFWKTDETEGKKMLWTKYRAFR